jgi:FG-GAP repeat
MRVFTFTSDLQVRLSLASMLASGLLLGSVAISAPQTFETAKLVVPPEFDDIVFQDHLGRGLSATESVAWVGEPQDVVAIANEGSVFGFQRGPMGWTLEQHLMAAKTITSMSYGTALSFRDRWGIVGSPPDNSVQVKAGAIHLVELVGGAWTETAKVYAPDIDRVDTFGHAIGISGQLVLASVPGDDDGGVDKGGAYLFQKTPAGLVFVDKLIPRYTGGPIWKGAGFEADLGGKTAVLGGIGTYGVAFVFEETSNGWKQTAILEDPAKAKNDGFGYSVAVDGDIIAIGEPVPIQGDIYRTGAVFIYERTGPPPGNWTLTQKLKASNAAMNAWGGDEFGRSVDLHEGRLLVGAPWGQLNNQIVGSAHIFEKQGGQWVETALLAATDQDQSDFGRKVSLSASFALIGAENAEGSVPGIDSGAAYVFELPFGEPTCDGVPNSTGVPATLHATGSLAASAQALELWAGDLPPNQAGLFLVSQAAGFVATPPGSEGNLCLGGTIGRFAGSLASSGPAGELHYVVDTDGLPLPPPAKILPGETWYFQAWFRDQNPGLTSNFTPGIAIAFR